MSTSDGGPAFPVPESMQDNGRIMQSMPVDYRGMSLRDYLAAKALQGLLANPGGPVQASGKTGWALCNCKPAHVAHTAYEMADAMMAERERTCAD